ncbi:hypothetical protein VOLCADRAFT_106184 [Volvox carteri f. nagariensis]|uniref:Aminotransferase class I/classII large domain-containing protein n=1 Tax=Volvox carteri f. nagariensis TaxID=3068 RepID=D8U5N1_VOLCA|nr:uncharacterized protein VOLCADRAFT_106184 [Volvox carteri f. nagariensis]EFJ44947.1 hypothetical protein VOLCADRAFT_106184 [Volvox carteri f. nagariensis]|eukprot:XP_002953918.1 hypothetical protein VOLCADRAFT_106184 [Volvox carteri f. nagariensis]
MPPEAAPMENGSAKAGAFTKPLNELFSSLPTTIFEVMSKLAMEHGSVNLGQGFPDAEGPETMKEIASKAMYDFHNQYPSLLGVPELRQAVARHSETNQGIPVDWATETLVTVGATEGLAACFLGLLNPGDEVIMFDPMYDSYVSMARRSGATIVPVRLQLPDFSVPLDELAAVVGPRTKMIMLNSPHNPSGKVFTRSELEAIAELCIRHDVIALCDEVYEHLVFGGAKHISLRALPGMAERCVRLGSAGKTFSFTAWKVGWMTGPARLMSPIIKAHQFLVFTVPSSLQRAVAHGLENESEFYLSLGPSLGVKRRYLEEQLAALGFGVLPAHGAYFLVADVSKFLRPGEDDVAFAKRLTVEGGVTIIPISGFYVGSSKPTHLARYDRTWSGYRTGLLPDRQASNPWGAPVTPGICAK